MLAGSILAGKYRLEVLLGRGGMGSVWRATHLGLHAPVAIKLIEPHIVVNPDAVERFHREARAAAGLRSPHVVQILDHGVDDATQAPFIAMELLEGESLAQRLERLQRLSPEETARVLSHVSRALSRAHESGIVHRDLKPDNVFIVRNDDEEVAKVLDFGIAKSQGALGADSATRTGAVMGTPYYMSPEQISGAKNVDFRADLWALGVIACECLTGTRPFDAETIGGLALKICVEPLPRPSSLGPVPVGFDAWFERAVARPPLSRFGSARELAEELRRVCAGDVLAVAAAAGHSASSPSVDTAAVPAGSAASMGALSRTSDDSALVRRGSAGFGWALAAVFLVLAGGAGAWFRFGSSGAEKAGSTPPLTSEPRPVTVAAPSASPPIAADPREPLPPASAPPEPPAPIVSAAPPASVSVVAPARSPRPVSTRPTLATKVVPAGESTKQPEAAPTSAASAPKLDARSVINSRR